MTIFDEELISRLCDDHLKKTWAELWKIHKALKDNKYTNNKNAQEFNLTPIHLAHRMNMVYNQLLKRGLSPRLKPPSPFHVSDMPFTQLLNELKHYVPIHTRKAQLEYLNSLRCECKQ